MAVFSFYGSLSCLQAFSLLLLLLTCSPIALRLKNCMAASTAMQFFD
jgi:hypothetical protein